MKVNPKFPFTFENDESLKEIGSLDSIQAGDHSIILKYKLRVDSEAVTGYNEIDVELLKNGYTEFTKQFPIEIETLDATLRVGGITSSPQSIVRIK